MDKTIALLGGDLRQVHLARMLAADGWDAVTWGLERGEAPSPVSLEEAAARPILVLPLPVGREGRLILPLSGEELPLEALWPMLRPGQLLLGGQAGTLKAALASDFGLTLEDYFDREETQAANAVPTAEGAVQRAMEATDRVLLGARCLVVGYGRIGKVLCSRLAAMGARVTAAARRYETLAWARAMGCEALPMEALGDRLGEFEVIFNTVPAPVLGRTALERTGADCLLMELASPPGGIDGEAAKALGRRYLRASGLPGQVAPRTAAAILLDSIYHILEERGVPI